MILGLAAAQMPSSAASSAQPDARLMVFKRVFIRENGLANLRYNTTHLFEMLITATDVCPGGSRKNIHEVRL